MPSLLYLTVTVTQLAMFAIVLFLAYRAVTILQRMALDLETLSRMAQTQAQPLNVDRP